MDRKVCDYYESFFGGSCFCNGMRCYYPLSCEGCEIQCGDEKGLDPKAYKRYNAEWNLNYEKQSTTVIKHKVLDRFFERFNDRIPLVDEYFIPYSVFDSLVREAKITAIDSVIDKFREDLKEETGLPEIRFEELWICHNATMADVPGIYFITAYSNKLEVGAL